MATDKPMEMELIEADFYPEDGEYVRIMGKLPAGTAVRKYATVEFHDKGSRTIKVTWSPSSIEEALRRFTAYRDGQEDCPGRSHQLVQVAIDALRAAAGVSDG